MEPRVDFSRFSKVKDSLREKLVREYDKKKALADDELDEVAAAVAVYRPPYRYKTDNAR